MIPSCPDALAKVDDEKDEAVIRIAKDFVEAMSMCINGFAKRSIARRSSCARLDVLVGS